MAAKTGSSSSKTFTGNPKKSRKGIHTKTKASKSKNSKNYKKTYKGQGR